MRAIHNRRSSFVALGFLLIGVVVGACSVFILVGRSGTSTSQAGAANATAAAPGPLSVAVYGDSLITQAEPYLVADLANANRRVTVAMDDFPGTALCDWLPQMRTTAGSTRPNTVVIEFSGNIFTPCISQIFKDGGSTAVAANYQRDLRQAIAIFEGVGTQHIIVAGAPTMANSRYRSTDTLVRQGYISTVAKLNDPRVTYEPAGQWVDDPHTDGFALIRSCIIFEQIRGLCTGPAVAGMATDIVRSSDGVHFCNDSASTTRQREPTWCPGAWRYANAITTSIMNHNGFGPLPPTP